MTKRMLIDALHPEEMRVAIADNTQIYEFDFSTAAKKQLKGNVYLAKITRVEPSLQAAFVEYGGGKQGFLPFAEIHPDYYQIPVSDRRRLMEEVERENAEAEDDDDRATVGSVEQEMGEATLAAADTPLEQESAIAEPMEFTVPLGPEILETADEPAEETARASEPATQETVSTEPREESAPPEGENGAQAKEEAKEEGVETIANEEEEMSGRRRSMPFFKRYRIQEVIKRGQIVLVQVIKEERGNKGVSLTTYLSLAGRYCVLMPNSPRDGGVHRQISDNATRTRLKPLMAELKTAKGMSVIIRTAGIDRTRTEIRRDFDYLVKLWNSIREITLASTAPALVYEEGDLIKRAIRDQYTSDIEEVLVEGEEAYRSARDFMKMLLPSHTPRVKLYKENMPLFYAHGIEEQLLSMHDPVVKLKSGGYIVLNPTEALISIDVNSGRSTGERNIEETATKTNLEAAAEIARQLRLRDLAGLIVIDFIDMMESRNRRNVERSLKDALRADRAKIQLGRISPFGLLEMSRQRLRPSISESSSVQCPHCSGRGVIRSNESLTLQIVRSLEKDASTGNWQQLKLCVPEHMALHLLNHKRALLTDIEERYGVQIAIAIDHTMAASQFTLERTRRGQGQKPEYARNQENADNRRNRGRNAGRYAQAMQEAEAETSAGEEGAEQPEEAQEFSRDGGRTRRRRRGGRRNRGEGTANDATPAESLAEPAEAVYEGAGETETTEEPRTQRGGRGRGRGRRRWKDEGGDSQATPPMDAVQEETSDAAGARARPPRRRRNAEREEAPVMEGKVMSFAPEESYTQPPRQESATVHAIPTVGVDTTPTHRPDGAPPRKGWWQKMIELD